MPIVSPSSYKPPFLFSSAPLQTLYPLLYRAPINVNYLRESLTTPDDDFLDLDWIQSGSNKVAILLHGLEGSSRAKYMRGMAKALSSNGWDVAAMNFRGCGGKPNNRSRWYHAGVTDDLNCVTEHIKESGKYQAIALIGFSLGANVVLKYVGEQGESLDSSIQAAIAYSPPCDLKSSALELSKIKNRFYMRRFLAGLYKKLQLREKAGLLPQELSIDDYASIKSFKDFDEQITAPLHGYKDANDYWTQCSSKQYLENIKIPTLLVSAKNDTFLGAACYPYKVAERHKYLHLETPNSGGHVGFITFNDENLYWSERRAVEFLRKYI